MKKFALPALLFSFLLLFSCENDGCECIQKTYSYPDDSHPIFTEETVDCPEGITEDNPVVVYLPEPDDQLLDYVISQICN